MAINKEKSLEGLKKIYEICPKAVVQFGTVLGLVREGKFLDWDGDVDVSIVAEDWKEEYLDAFIAAGFSINRKVFWDKAELMQYVGSYAMGKLSKFQMTYGSKENRFCFNIMQSGTGGHRFHYEGGKWGLFHCPRYFIEETTKAYFYDMEVNVPKDIEGYLVFMYGEYWQTPRQTYYFTVEHERNRKKFIINI